MTTSDAEFQSSRTFSLRALMEQWPLLIAGMLFCGFLAIPHILSPDPSSYAQALVRMYWAGFGWSAFQVLTCVTICCLVVAANHGFLKQMQGTNTLAAFKRSLKRTIVVSLFLMIASLPLIIGGVPTAALGFWHVFAAFWTAAVVGCALAFFRIVSIFFVIFSTEEPRFYGA